MKVYVGNAYGKKQEMVRRYGLGIMIATCHRWKPEQSFSEFPCALDNGAFRCWQLGYPFQADLFKKRIAECHKAQIGLDFIVCPDLVARGEESLAFSMEWAHGELKSAPRLALALQDGMQRNHLNAYHLKPFSCLFVGGTIEWKWQTAADWVKFGHDHGKLVHIGRAGQKGTIQRAREMGADSVDSTSAARNDTWEEIFGDSKQLRLWEKEQASCPAK